MPNKSKDTFSNCIYSAAAIHTLSRKPATALEVGSLVQLVEDPTRTGRIRWMGTPPETKAFMAGV